MVDVSYAKRESVLEKGERSWRVTDAALVITEADGRFTEVPYSAVTGLRLAFVPASAKPWRHVCVVITRPGRVFEIDNGHFKGVGDFEDRSAAYRTMVEALVGRLVATGSPARLHVGATAGAYAAQLILVLAVAVVLGWVLVVTSFGVWPVTAIIKGIIVIVSLPLLVRWAIRARPRDVALTAIPADALPPAG